MWAIIFTVKFDLKDFDSKFTFTFGQHTPA